MTDALIASPLAHALGLALVHFLWQGASLGVICPGVLAACRRRSARTRYAIECLTLGVMVLAVAWTFNSYAMRFSSVRPVAIASIAAGTAATVQPAAAAIETTPLIV